jgi:hypothetical protein
VRLIGTLFNRVLQRTGLRIRGAVGIGEGKAFAPTGRNASVFPQPRTVGSDLGLSVLFAHIGLSETRLDMSVPNSLRLVDRGRRASMQDSDL